MKAFQIVRCVFSCAVRWIQKRMITNLSLSSTHLSALHPSESIFPKQKTKLEAFFVLNTQIGVHSDGNGESNDWQVSLLFFCCLSSPLCSGIKVLTVPLWFLDEDQRTYLQSSLVQQPPSTPGCCLYANAGLCHSRTTESLSVMLLVIHSRLRINLNSYSVWQKCHLWWSFVQSICEIMIPAKFNLPAKVRWLQNLFHCGFWGDTGWNKISFRFPVLIYPGVTGLSAVKISNLFSIEPQQGRLLICSKLLCLCDHSVCQCTWKFVFTFSVFHVCCAPLTKFPRLALLYNIK